MRVTTNMFPHFAIVCLALVVGAHAGAVELDGTTFEKEVTESGKSAFVKFFAPWCGHCKNMAPAWNQLGDEYADSSTVIIADVDCTKDDNKELCKKYGVKGYPTVKYFTAATSVEGDAYKGGRDYDALSAWAKANLGPICGADNLDACDDEQKKIIAEKSALSQTEVDAEIEAAESELKQADADLDELLKSLQSQYEAAKEKKDDTIAALSPKLALMRSVKRAKTMKDVDAAKNEL